MLIKLTTHEFFPFLFMKLKNVGQIRMISVNIFSMLFDPKLLFQSIINSSLSFTSHCRNKNRPTLSYMEILTSAWIITLALTPSDQFKPLSLYFYGRKKKYLSANDNFKSASFKIVRDILFQNRNTTKERIYSLYVIRIC